MEFVKVCLQLDEIKKKNDKLKRKVDGERLKKSIALIGIALSWVVTLNGITLNGLLEAEGITFFEAVGQEALPSLKQHEALPSLKQHEAVLPSLKRQKE